MSRLLATALAVLCLGGCSAKMLRSMRLVTVVAQGDPDRDGLFAFGDGVAGSAWWPAVTGEYGVGPAGQSAHVEGPALNAPLSFDALAAYVGGALPASLAPDGNTLYLVYLPAAASLTDRTAEAEHAPFPSDGASSGDVWAFVTRGHAFPGGETDLESLTRLASHEIVEAATDPLGTGVNFGSTPTAPWTAPVRDSYEASGEVEVGDLCEGTRVLVPGPTGTWEYQRIWSERAAAQGGDPCVPAGAAPYFTVRADRDWTQAEPGRTALVSLAATATAPRGAWLLTASVVNGSAGFSGVAANVSSARGEAQQGPTCTPYPAAANGDAPTLALDVPATARSGDWAVVSVCSFDEDPASCYPAVGGDVCHASLVGVYVP